MSLTLHRDLHSGKTKCPVCQRAFSRVHDMRTHVQKKHFEMTMNFNSRATIVATTTTTTTMSRSEEACTADTQTSNSPCGSSNRVAAMSTDTPIAQSPVAAPGPPIPPLPTASEPDAAAVAGPSGTCNESEKRSSNSCSGPEITVKLSRSRDSDDSSGEDELIIVTTNNQ